jgi:hypothetical protein
VDDSNRDMYDEVGAAKHGRMPYNKVPGQVLGDDEALMEWAQLSIQVSRDAK